jgi:hypothetical protein
MAGSIQRRHSAWAMAIVRARSRKPGGEGSKEYLAKAAGSDPGSSS